MSSVSGLALKNFGIDPSGIRSKENFLQKQEDLNFFKAEYIENWLQTEYPKEQKTISTLRTIDKVIAVSIAVLSAFFPLALFYLPAWAPWGIGLPILFVAAISQAKLKSKIEQLEPRSQYGFFQKALLLNQSENVLHPIGEWNLKEADARCKSDNIAKYVLNKQHPVSAEEIEKTLSYLNLETVTPYVKELAAEKFSCSDGRETHWKEVQKVAGEAKRSFRKNDLERFARKREESLVKGYAFNQAFRPNSLPVLSVEDQVHLFFDRYAYYRDRLFEDVSQLHEQGEKRWKSFQYIGEQAKFQLWEAYINFNDEMNKLIEPLLKQKGSVDELKILNAVEQQNLILLLENQIDKTYQLKEELLKWIKNHPFHQLKEIQEQIREYKQHEVFNVEQLRIFSDWIFDHKELSQKSTPIISNQLPLILREYLKLHPEKQNDSPQALFGIIQKHVVRCQSYEVFSFEQLKALSDWIDQNRKFDQTPIILIPNKLPSTLRDYFKQHPQKRYETPRSLLNIQYTFSRKLSQTIEQFNLLVDTCKQIDSVQGSQSAEEYAQVLEEFRTQSLMSLKELILLNGEDSKCALWFKSIHKKTPAKPFTKPLSSKNEALDARKFVAYQIDMQLKEIDQSMLTMNRVRSYGLLIPLRLLLPVATIFMIYLPSVWIFWSMSFITLAGYGASYYLETRLHKMEEKKQAIKLQRLLFSRDPRLRNLPGNRPKLSRIQEIQKRYDLDGIEATWARGLAIGDDAIVDETPDNFQNLAQEGSQLAATYLENRLMAYRQAYRQSKDPGVLKEMKSIEACLKPKKSSDKTYKKAELSAYEKNARYRNQLNDAWDRVLERMQVLKIKIRDYQTLSRRFEQLPNMIENYQRRVESVAANLKQLQATIETSRSNDIPHQQVESQNIQLLSLRKELEALVTKKDCCIQELEFLQEHPACGSKENINEQIAKLEHELAELKTKEQEIAAL